MFYGMGMFWDPTYYLVLIGMVLCLGASALVNSTIHKYSKVHTVRNITGAEAARRILDQEGLYQVQVVCLVSRGGDHYDPRTETISLTPENYNGASVAAVSVAAHECGHAIQNAMGYFPLTLRTYLVPVVNIGSNLGLPIIIFGVLLGWNSILIQIGIWAFSLSVLFQLVTLPVEFNASKRAIQRINEYELLSTQEDRGCKKVLTAAALTYVAAAASSILQLLRLILLFGNRRKSD